MGSQLAANSKQVWWKDGTFYQIWPASYKDANGDGIGDIPGIISTLDYLKDLGVDIIWISPMYKSPQKDMGYDISDYEDIDPQYGTLQDVEQLIKECHGRGMRLIFDLVINHTSDLHQWFKDSRSTVDNPKRDWYIWRPPKHQNGERRPPNNWKSYFGGSAWEWDEQTQEYYLHLFCREQPDLNWENEATREAIYQTAVKFWLDKGIDGFRIDTVNFYSKPLDFPDGKVLDPSSEFQLAPEYWANGPRMHEFLQELNSKVLSHYDCCTVGELGHTHEASKILQYVSADAKQLNMVFQFDVVGLGTGSIDGDRYKTSPVSIPALKASLKGMQSLTTTSANGWTTSFLENHDIARSVSRFGCIDTPELRERSAKMLATMLATLSGTLFIYQGQEIGMTNVPADWDPSEYKDVDTLNYLDHVRKQHPSAEKAYKEALYGVSQVARDHARTPVQWNDGLHAGFTSGEKPWMRVNDNYPEINVAKQSGDSNSLLSFWKKLLQLRKGDKNIWIHGGFSVFEPAGENTVIYGKMDREGHMEIKDGIIVALNFSSEKQSWSLPKGWALGDLILGNIEGSKEKGFLEPWEGQVYAAKIEVISPSNEGHAVNEINGSAH